MVQSTGKTLLSELALLNAAFKMVSPSIDLQTAERAHLLSHPLAIEFVETKASSISRNSVKQEHL